MNIELSNISISFNGRQILQNFSMSVQKGEKVLLRGHSGIGKSTILRMILGFVRPDSGEVKLDGHIMDARIARIARRRIAWVPQDAVMPTQTLAKDFAHEVLAYKYNTGHADYSGFLSALLSLGIPEERLNETCGKLSGGEKQRVLTACSIMLGRDTFLLDEPTSGLDNAHKHDMIRLFADRAGWTVLAVSHDDAWLSFPVFRIVELEPLAGGEA